MQSRTRRSGEMPTHGRYDEEFRERGARVGVAGIMSYPADNEHLEWREARRIVAAFRKKKIEESA